MPRNRAPERDLADLVERLRSAGFRVDTRQYLTAHELLLAWAARGRRLEDDTAALISHLGPVFCTSAREQDRFGDVVRAWLSPPRRERRRPLREPTPFRSWRHRRWLLPSLLILLAALAAALPAWWYATQPVLLPGRVYTLTPDGARLPAAQARLDLAGTTVVVDATGRFQLELRRRDGPQDLSVELPGYRGTIYRVDAETPQPLELWLSPLPALPPVPPATTEALVTFGEPRVIHHPPSPPNLLVERVTPWGLAIPWGVLTALVAYALWTLAEWLRRTLILRRLPADGRAELKTLVTDPPAPRSLDDRAFRRLAADLRRPRGQAARDLDVKASVQATIRRSGLFQPVWKARQVTPEYLVLIGRHDLEDHQTRLYDELMQRLADRGVALDVLYFRDDPRLCHREDARPAALGELVQQHHRAVLFLHMEAQRCFNPISGEPEPWLEACTVWSRRVLFTPVPPAHWTRHEKALAEAGWLVLPAGEAGLAAYTGIGEEWRIDSLFPAAYARPYPPLLTDTPGRWLLHSAPPAPVVENLVRQLHGYLGKDGFAWLAACAVYPEVAWPLTLRMAETLPELARRPERVAALLPALARLPWFRHGAMPDWLRLTLISLLTPAQKHVVHRSLEALLERAADAMLAGRRAPGLNIAAWIGPMDVLRTEPAGSPLRDTVFIGYLSGVNLDALSLLAPSSLGRLFRRLHPLPAGRRTLGAAGGWLRRMLGRLRGWLLDRPALGRSMIAGALGLAVTGLLATLLTRTVEQTLAPQPGEFTAMALSQDGRRLAAASTDSLGRIWDVTGGAPVVLEGHGGGVADIAFSPDGSRVATASEDGSAKLWDAASGSLLHVLQHEGPVGAVAFSPDGNRVATGAADGTVRLWATANGSELTRVDAGRPVASVRFVPDGSQLVTEARGEGWQQWRLEAAGLRTLAVVPAAGIAGLRFSPDGSRLVTVSSAGPVQVLATSDRRVLATLGARDAPAADAAFSPDGRWVVTAGEDGVVRLWEAGSGRLLASLPGDGRPLRQALIGPDGASLITLGSDRVLSWPLRSKPPAIRPPEQKTADVRLPDRQALVITPRVVGLRLDMAEKTLAGAGLRMGPVATQTLDGRMPPGTIIGQSPQPGAQVARGSAVSLQVQGVPVTAQKATVGWCCIIADQTSQRQQPGGVFPMDVKECQSRGGLYYEDEVRAREECARFAGLGRDNVAPTAPAQLRLQAY